MPVDRDPLQRRQGCGAGAYHEHRARIAQFESSQLLLGPARPDTGPTASSRVASVSGRQESEHLREMGRRYPRDCSMNRQATDDEQAAGIAFYRLAMLSVSYRQTVSDGGGRKL